MSSWLDAALPIRNWRCEFCGSGAASVSAPDQVEVQVGSRTIPLISHTVTCWEGHALREQRTLVITDEELEQYRAPQT